MNMRLGIIGVVVVAAGVLLSDTFFTVSETQQALVLRFGNPQREPIFEPGLHVKAPFIDDVTFYESRILEVDPPAEEVTLRDQRRLVVDAFIRYRIDNPLLFLQRVRTEANAVDRLTTILNAALRNVLARYEQSDLLSSDVADVRSGRRAQIMQEIQRVVAFGLRGEDVPDAVAEGASDLGITIVDVRIGRADVPDQTRESIFTRMRSEREREAAEIRATGSASQERLQAFADRWRVGFLARAQRLSQIIQGEGDQRSIATLASAHALDQNFFGFYRTLEAYRDSMANEETALVLSPDGDFFRFFRQVSGGDGGSQLDVMPLDRELQEDIERRLIPSGDMPDLPAIGREPAGTDPDGAPTDTTQVPAEPQDEASLGEGEAAAEPIPTDIGTIDEELQDALAIPGDLRGLIGVDDIGTAIDAELSDVLETLQADEDRLIDPSGSNDFLEDMPLPSDPIIDEGSAAPGDPQEGAATP